MPETRRLAGDFAVTGQLRSEDLPGIAAQGFRTIINNRPDGEAPDQPPSAELAAAAGRLGLDYRHIPVRPGKIDARTAAELAAALAELEKPVLAFCRSGSRSANLWMLLEPTGGGVAPQ
jgi:sulfide:quinone oxidoreductase